LKADSGRWVEVTRSRFEHEREGLDHVREHLPDADPYRAWSNFEFVGMDGKHHEIDLLVLGPAGLHLVELKAWTGRITGDEQDWVEHNPGAGRAIPRRSPLGLTRLKAQSFRSWLEHQARQQRSSGLVPYVHESLFLHGFGVDCRLPDRVKERVFGREDAGGNGLQRIVTDRLGMAPQRGAALDAPRARSVAALLERAGLRRRPAELRVGEWVLDEDPYDDGWGWQDTLAQHHAFADERARVRRWFVPPGSSARDAAVVRRAAEREYRMVRGLDHPGLIAPSGFFEDDRAAAALVYPHRDSWQRLPDWLQANEGSLDVLDRLSLIRSVAEVVRYAHDHGLVHRGLSPASVLVDSAAPAPVVRVKDWQTAGRAEPATTTATAHARDLLAHARDDRSSTYAAPELLTGAVGDRRSSDVFSLGALAFRVLTGRDPADDVSDLRERLRTEDGLDLSSALDAPDELLQLAVLEATRPAVCERTATVDQLIGNLDTALDSLTEPDFTVAVLDPLDAQAGTVLEGGYVVRKLLGEGGTSVALLVGLPDGRDAVLKAARDHERAGRLEAEAQALNRLGDSNLVANLIDGPLTVGGRLCLLVEVAGERTLADELRREGRTSLDRLSLWGRDLFEVVALLERTGQVHRDIKPANLGFRTRGADGRPHLVLFDFSLSSASARDLASGTRGYLDPFLGGAGRRQYDVAAELFAAVVTLHELATGALPRWGDGDTDPASIVDEVTIAVDQLDPAAAEPLATFFERALARDVSARFANPQDASAAWDRALADAAATNRVRDPDLASAAATLSTPLGDAGLSPRALSALERYAVGTVADLLGVDPFELARLPGAAQRTKDEVVRRTKQWRARLRPAGSSARSVDAVVARLLRDVPLDDPGRCVRALLGQPDAATSTGPMEWPTTQLVANELDVERADVSDAWRGFLKSVTDVADVVNLREEVLGSLQSLGGIASAGELATRVLDARGSHVDPPQRMAQATALVRLAVESNQGSAAPTGFRRPGDVLLVAGGEGDDPTTLDERLDVAARLQPVAEELARAEVLAAPTTVLTRLQELVVGTVLQSLPDNRLVSLAAATTTTVAVSPRGELYARRMPALKALRHAQGAVVAAGSVLPEETLRRRVRARFPEATLLPGRPALDQLLLDAGTGLTWTGDGYGVAGATSRRASTRSSTWHGVSGAPERFSDRLRTSLEAADFVALSVPARLHDLAVSRLLAELELTHLDLTQDVVRRVRSFADREGVVWADVLAADALPPLHPDRQLVDDVVRQAALDSVHDLARGNQPVLLTDAALLARHRCVELLAPLASFDGARSHARFLLVPQETSQQTPTLDGAAVPVGSPNQWLPLPTAWLHGADARTA